MGGCSLIDGGVTNNHYRTHYLEICMDPQIHRGGTCYGYHDMNYFGRIFLLRGTHPFGYL